MSEAIDAPRRTGAAAGHAPSGMPGAEAPLSLQGAEAPLLLHVFPSFGVGGAQMRFATLAARFGSRYRHAVVALDGNTECRAHLPPDLPVAFPDFVNDKRTPWANVRRARALMRTLRPEVLVTSNWGTIEWAAARIGLPPRHVHTEDGFGPEERSTQIRRRVLARRAVLRRSAVVLPSMNLLGIARDTWRLDPARLHYIPNGIDLDRFAPRPRPASDVPVIGTVATFRQEKNLPRLLRAFAAAVADTPARLVMVGDGPERNALEQMAAELGVLQHVLFPGASRTPEALYAGFDLFALSSDTEQMPLSLMEAMAAGLPAVTTDVGDIRRMVSPDNAEFIVPLDDTAFAQALRSLLRQAALRQQIGAANRRAAERAFSEERMVRAHQAVLDAAIAGTALDAASVPAAAGARA